VHSWSGGTRPLTNNLKVTNFCDQALQRSEFNDDEIALVVLEGIATLRWLSVAPEAH